MAIILLKIKLIMISFNEGLEDINDKFQEIVEYHLSIQRILQDLDMGICTNDDIIQLKNKLQTDIKYICESIKSIMDILGSLFRLCFIDIMLINTSLSDKIKKRVNGMFDKAILMIYHPTLIF